MAELFKLNVAQAAAEIYRARARLSQAGSYLAQGRDQAALVALADVTARVQLAERLLTLLRNLEGTHVAGKEGQGR